MRMIKKVDICRHLKLAHDEVRPKGKEFKGFFSFDKEKFTVAWGDRGENFPDEEMIEIEGEDQLIHQDPPVANNEDSLPLVTDNGYNGVAGIQTQNANIQNVFNEETDSLPMVTEGSEDIDTRVEILIQAPSEENISLPLVQGLPVAEEKVPTMEESLHNDHL